MHGSLHTPQAPFPGNILTGPHIHEFGCQNPPLRILGKEPILSQQPLHSPPTAHLPELLRTPPHWAWETKGHSHSPPPYSTLLGIQPPSPGARGPQLSRAAPPPISPPAFWEFPAASELPIPNSYSFSWPPTTPATSYAPFSRPCFLSTLPGTPYPEQETLPQPEAPSPKPWQPQAHFS